MAEARSLADVIIDDGLRKRFNDNVWKHESGCWRWCASTDKDGYGEIRVDNNRRQILAHRLSWLLAYGDPGTLLVLHTCDTPCCVNPDHLFLGTNLDNSKDCIAKSRHTFKFSKEIVEAIRKLAIEGITSTRIARMFNMDASHVRRIIARKSRKNI